MKIAILGTGSVGNTIGDKLIQLGHEVRLGSRTADNVKGVDFVQKNGSLAGHGTFADVAAFADIIFNCTKGEASLEALRSAGAENMKGKVIIDVSNPLDSSQGMPPTLSISNTNSLGEEIQKAYPESFVVKTLNTMWCGIMVNPRMLSGTHQVFMCGNDVASKETVKSILLTFGWEAEEIMDLGDITSSRGTEMYLPLWLRMWMATGNGAFNIRIVR